MFNKNIFKQKDSVAEAISKIVEAEAKMEELKGQQHKIDKNKNNKIDAQDFAILRGEKKVKNNIGKLVGANESVELSEMDKSQPSSDRGGESSGDPYAKGGKATPLKPKDAAKDVLKTLNKAMDKAHKKDVKEEVEQIDELKKSTLASYAKKATDDVSYHSFSAGSRSATDPERLKDDEKAMKRQAGVSKAVDRLSKEEVEQQDESSHNPFSKDYKSQIPSKPGEKAGFDSKKISTGTVYSRKPPKEEPKKDKQDVAEGSVDPTHKKILDKEKNKVPRKPKDEYERKVERYLKSKYSKNKNVAEGTESGQEYHDRMHRLAAGYHGMDPQRRARMEKIPGWKDQYNQALAYAEKHPKKEEPKKEEYNFAGKLLEGISFYTESQLDEMINEVLGKDATAGDWIHDFVHSDNPKFKGKSKAKRKEMALAAYYAKQRNEEVEQIDEVYDIEHMKYINTKECDKHFEDGHSTMMKHIGDEFQKVNAKRYASQAFKQNPHKKGTKEYKAWHHGADAASDEHISSLHEAAKWRSTSEVEQIDELNKETLKKYVAKATDSARTMPGYGTKAEKSKKTIRQVGVSRATEKLAKEEVNEWIDPSVKTVDTLRGREKVKKDDVLGKGGDFKSPKVKFLPDPVDEGKRPESDTVPFVTSENKPLERVKEMARASMKKMKSEMMGKAGTSE